jgi:hypothetical protein
MPKLLHFWLFSLSLFITGAATSMAFDDEDTHPRMTELSVRRSAIDITLTEIGLPRGINTALSVRSGPPRTVLQWFRAGAILEDDPACRAGNHFHNPLLPFSNSGVTDQPFWIRLFCSRSQFSQVMSNVTWATGFTSPTERGSLTGNSFDWDSARRSYLKALALPAPAEREASLAETFEILGHVMHLVQDLAVPAHVRNDFQSHLEFCSPSTESFSHWCENAFEHFVRMRPALVDSAAGISIPSANRLTRFWDIDQYNGINPSTDTTQGLAEYTNANFPSQNTIFTETLPLTDPHSFPYPRQTSTDIEDLIAHRTRATVVTAEDGSHREGLYLRKLSDGEGVEHFLKAGYWTTVIINNPSLRSFLPLTFQIDDVAMNDYAAKLLPRAIGYSASLLDYFFRGKLDVDLIEDSIDPSILRLTGINASDDTLVGGNLKLYGDDASATRVELASTSVSGVSKGQTLPELTAQAPDGAERFVAVYEGTLGQELRDEAQNNPGAVIGKVLGGVRVEEVFSDGPRWYLRTPKGVFPLPIPTGNVASLRWGENDNVLVGHSYFYSGITDVTFYVYEINRTVGSSDVPLVDVDGTPHVDARLVKQASFPFNLKVGTAEFQETVHYQQYTLSFIRNAVYKWTCDQSGECHYGLTSLTISEPNALVYSEDVPLEHKVSLRLDPDSLMPWLCCPSGYLWEFRDFGLSAGGQILALVNFKVFSGDESKPVPVFTLELRGGVPEWVEYSQPETVYRTALPRPIDVWALIDVASGTVVASTGPEVVRISYEGDLILIGRSRFENTAVMLQRDEYVGGPLAQGPKIVDLIVVPRKGCGSNPPALKEIDLHIGLHDAKISQYKSEIENVQFPLEVAESDPWEFAPIYACPESDGVGAKFQFNVQEVNFSLGRIDDMRLTLDGGERRLLMLMAQNPAQGSFLQTFQPKGRVAVWKSSAGGAELRQEFPSVALTRELLSQTSRLGLLRSFGFNPSTFQVMRDTTLVSLSGPHSSTAFPDEEMTQFVLLEPDFLYNTVDLKFYRRRPPLQRTALPAKLAEAFFGWPQAYHVVRLK